MNYARVRMVSKDLATELGLDPYIAYLAIEDTLQQLLQAERIDSEGHPPVVMECGGSSGTSIAIPWMPKKHGKPLRQAIGWAANSMGVDLFKSIKLMTYFLQGIVAQVDQGQLVRIPGFGVFGPFLWINEKTDTSTVYPRFVPSRAFRNEVSVFCPEEWAKNHELQAAQRSHNLSSHRARMKSMTRKAMQSWRTIIDSHDPQ